VQELLDGTIPGRTNIWVERDGALIWGGIVTTRTYQSESYTYQIDAQTFDAFMQGQFQTTDQASTTDDPRNVILHFWANMQSQSATNLRVAGPNFVTPVNPQYTYSWTGTDYDTNSDLIASAVQAGAEYRLDFGYDVNGVRTCYLVLGRWDQTTPGYTIGVPPTGESVTFRYPGSISNFWVSESGPQGATYVLGIGQSNAASTPRGTATNTSFIAQGWPQYGLKFNWTNIVDQTTLNNMLANALQQFQPPFVTPTFKLNGSYDYGSFNLGDYLHIVIDDPYRYPEGPHVTDIRVIGMELSPATDDSVEQANFTIDQPSASG
jgi:hypothetical protein